MFKKIILASLLSFGAFSTTVANADTNTKKGDICEWSLMHYSIPKFRCYSLFDREIISLNDIYEKGYRVVAISQTDRFTTIVIESQD